MTANYDYDQDLKRIWLEYGHPQDDPEVDFNWKSWHQEGKPGR